MARQQSDPSGKMRVGALRPGGSINGNVREFQRSCPAGVMPLGFAVLYSVPSRQFLLQAVAGLGHIKSDHHRLFLSRCHVANANPLEIIL